MNEYRILTKSGSPVYVAPRLALIDLAIAESGRAWADFIDSYNAPHVIERREYRPGDWEPVA